MHGFHLNLIAWLESLTKEAFAWHSARNSATQCSSATAESFSDLVSLEEKARLDRIPWRSSVAASWLKRFRRNGSENHVPAPSKAFQRPSKGSKEASTKPLALHLADAPAMAVAIGLGGAARPLAH